VAPRYQGALGPARRRQQKGLGMIGNASRRSAAAARSRRCGGRFASAALAASALVFAMPGARAQPLTSFYVFQDVVDTFDVTFNQELGINNSGIIAGYFGSGAAGHPNKGYTIAGAGLGGPVVQTGFVNENFPNSVQTQVTGLNNRGVTVGFWSKQNKVNLANNNFGFVNIGGQRGVFINVNNPNTGKNPKINQLLGVNDFNVAVGFYVDGKGATHGYKYGIMFNKFSANIDDPNGVGTTTAAAINNLGQVAGFFVDSKGVMHGFFDKNGTFTTIDGPKATATALFGLNNLGVAVGFDVDKAMKMHGVVCAVANATCQELDDPKGIGTTTFNGLNDDGDIVGFYMDAKLNTIGLLATRLPPLAAVALKR
jgi:hypothetical protein